MRAIYRKLISRSFVSGVPQELGGSEVCWALRGQRCGGLRKYEKNDATLLSGTTLSLTKCHEVRSDFSAMKTCALCDWLLIIYCVQLGAGGTGRDRNSETETARVFST